MNHFGTILIVEDETDLRDILEMILQEMKVKILKAENGAKALEIIEAQEINAIISDINMPVMSGLELLRKVRNLGQDIPFVFVTGYGDKANLLEALRLGAMDFLEKPFQNSEVLKVMEKALELGLSLHEVQAELNSFYSLLSLPPTDVENTESEIYAYKRKN